MDKKKRKHGRISVFKGRETKLNHAIFHILALKGPLATYDVYKELRKQKSLRHTKYAVVNRRVRTLEESRYLEKAGTRKTQADFKATLYQLSTRGYLALMLNQINIETILQKADKTTILSLLATLSSVK